MSNIGIYVHIPFCKQKCYYCDFISFANKIEKQEKYTECIKKEIKNCNLDEKKISTIYFGGGTPSYIDSKYINEILCEIKNKWNIKEQEITIEINPGTVDLKKLQDYKKMGINRLSIGLQSTNNNLLKEIGRIHTYEQFLYTYKLAREVGFKNINVDLMLGLPNQKISDLKESLEKVIDLEPEHISVYSLIIEEGTKISKMIEDGKLKLPEEEKERNMYWYVKNILELNGYKHYEISNFSKAGFESKHNMDCWSQKEYIGFGVAAHSYINKKRFYNTDSLDKYIENIENNKFEENIYIEEIQQKEDEEKEFVLLAFRKIQGVSVGEFKNKFAENPLYVFRNEFDRLFSKGLIEVEGDFIKLTSKGLDFANLVWEEFVTG